MSCKVTIFLSLSIRYLFRRFSTDSQHTISHYGNTTYKQVEQQCEREHCEEEQDVHRPRREYGIGAEKVADAHIDEKLQDIQPVGSVAAEGANLGSRRAKTYGFL